MDIAKSDCSEVCLKYKPAFSDSIVVKMVLGVPFSNEKLETQLRGEPVLADSFWVDMHKRLFESNFSRDGVEQFYRDMQCRFEPVKHVTPFIGLSSL